MTFDAWCLELSCGSRTLAPFLSLHCSSVMLIFHSDKLFASLYLSSLIQNQSGEWNTQAQVYQMSDPICQSANHRDLVDNEEYLAACEKLIGSIMMKLQCLNSGCVCSPVGEHRLHLPSLARRSSRTYTRMRSSSHSHYACTSS